jgi:hypothetical protein
MKDVVSLSKGQRVTLLTSYCEDTSICTDKQPCPSCMDMANTYILQESVRAVYSGEVQNAAYIVEAENEQKTLS